MNCSRRLTDTLYWVGANDRRIALFENVYPVPRGVSYNSYLLLDEKTALFDTIDQAFTHQLLENVSSVLDGRSLDYLIVNHMEPDHCASIADILFRYPGVKIVCTAKAANMPAAVTAAIVICFFSLFSVIIASLKADVLSSYNVCIPICDHKTTSLIIT